MKLRKLISNIIIAVYFLTQSIYGQYDTVTFSDKDWEFFPILNYDTDVGFGYGAKAFAYNFLGNRESFDVTAYNSTKGERWYRLVFSIPDMQRRQGKRYNAAFDLIIDYDKWINYLYYSDSNTDNNNDKNYEEYVREPLEISGVFSRAFKANLIGELGIRYKSISCYQFEKEGTLQFQKPFNVQQISTLLNLRFDTRSNFINPHSGFLIELSNEYAWDLLGQNQNFFKIGLTLQTYLQMFFPNLVFASRVIFQSISNVTYQNLLPVGGNATLRGLPQDRYLSQSLIIANEEIRFPILWRFGGIFGLDIANSKSTPYWILNPVVGLRLNMDNFIVRADLGFGEKETGFYFNFGHLF